MNEELKPCPWCNCAHPVIEWEPLEPIVEGDTNRRWFAECPNCCAQGPFCQRETEVAERWNRRADSARIAALESQLADQKRLTRIAEEHLSAETDRLMQLDSLTAALEAAQRERDESKAATDALMEIVEGVRGERWSANGKRLVDTPEWCRFYVAWRKNE